MFKLIKWVAIVGAMSVANYFIFGKYGVIVPVSISGVLLMGLFLFQNKLLYMPGISPPIKISPICLIHLRLILLAIATPQNIHW
mgnify:CR=1 FL=1